MALEKLCTFCGKPVKKGYGMNYVKRDGAVLRFCSRKCKIFHLPAVHKKGRKGKSRNPRKLKWTAKYEPKIHE